MLYIPFSFLASSLYILRFSALLIFNLWFAGMAKSTFYQYSSFLVNYYDIQSPRLDEFICLYIHYAGRVLFSSDIPCLCLKHLSDCSKCSCLHCSKYTDFPKHVWYCSGVGYKFVAFTYYAIYRFVFLSTESTFAASLGFICHNFDIVNSSHIILCGCS